MKRVLFVDDEQQILDGLRDALRKQRQIWDMTFCTSASDALSAMEAAPFGVIVTDMRMPVMDGAALLAEVKTRYPATVRIVLSGQADRDLVMKMLQVSQQFLSKPCNTDRLRSAVERAFDLRELLDDPVILGLIGGLDTLPTVPATYQRLTEALASGTIGVGAIAGIVEQDGALSAKLLQIVNSAYFGLTQPVVAVPTAVNYLGLELLKALSLMVGIFGAADAWPAAPEYSAEAAQRQALLVASVARRIVTERVRRDEAFTTGILHDVGKLILATRLPKRYGAVLREAAAGGRPLRDIEHDLLGTSYASVGAVLLGTWGLPCSIVQSVAHHASPGERGYADDPVTLAVHVASALVSAALRGQSEAPLLDLAAIDAQGLLGALPEWQAITQELVRSAT